jgi:hypothetical protein
MVELPFEKDIGDVERIRRTSISAAGRNESNEQLVGRRSARKIFT